MDIDVRAVDPDDTEALAAQHAVLSAARIQDIPDFPPVCPVRLAGMLRHPDKATEVLAFLGYRDGVPVGALTVWLSLRDNLGTARVEIQVHPAWRRRGVGRALYAVAVERARARDRVRLVADSPVTLPGGVARDEAGRAFAEALGAKNALLDVRRRLDLSTVDIAALTAPQAPGYSVLHWRDRAPEELLADMGRLDSRLVLDAPSGDLVIEPWDVDADRIRDHEDSLIARGVHHYHSGIRHDASGALVAWTTLAFEPTIRDHAWQNITIVDPDHRGHRLGMWVKLANLRYTLGEEPALCAIDTWNAAANTHMIAINEAIGFRAVEGWIQWQHELSQ
jgi:GNAT superfamily N-acetyltransferase